MVSRQLLNIVMLVELGLLVLAVCLFFAHGLWLFFYERRVRRLTEAARDSLAHLATRGTVNVEEIEALRLSFLEYARRLHAERVRPGYRPGEDDVQVDRVESIGGLDNETS